MSMLGRAIAGLVAMTAFAAAQSAIISGSQLTGAGKAVNLSGLEWLSFDDAELGTFGVARTTIEAADSAWTLAGWRYATAYEHSALVQSLLLNPGGDTNGYYDSNNDGVDFLLSRWGRFTVPAFEGMVNVGLPSEARLWVNEYSFHRGIFGDVSGDAPNRHGTLAMVQSPLQKGYDYINKTQFQDWIDYDPSYYTLVSGTIDNVDLTTGSFLVRGAPPSGGPSSVPEPTSLGLVTIALSVLAFASRNHQRQ